MADKIAVISEKSISLSGYYDVRKTYTDIMSYIEDSLTYDPTVKDYEETNQDGTKEIISKVEADRKYNETYKIILKFIAKFKGKDIEGEINNKKIIIQKGTGNLTLNIYLEADWDSTRSKSSLYNFLSQIYEKFIGNDEQKKIELIAAEDGNKLIKKFKQHFNSTLK